MNRNLGSHLSARFLRWFRLPPVSGFFTVPHNFHASPAWGPFAEHLNPTGAMFTMTCAMSTSSADCPRHILIVDPHPVSCAGWAATLADCPEFKVCAMASTRKQVLDVLNQVRLDLSIVDPAMEDMDGLELVRSLAARHPRAPLVICSSLDPALYWPRLLRIGATACLPKQAPPDELLGLLRRLLPPSDASVPPKKTVPAPSPSAPALHALSDRELELFRLTGKGLSTPAIAEAMELSESSIHAYRLQIKRKLALHELSDLVRHAIEWEQRQH